MRASGLLCQCLVNNNKLNNSVNSVLFLIINYFIRWRWGKAGRLVTIMKITLKKEEVTKILQCMCNSLPHTQPIDGAKLCRNDDIIICQCYSCIALPCSSKEELFPHVNLLMLFMF